MRHKENTILGFISGAAIGAGLMYLADPDRGSRRRSGVRDKVAHGFRSFGSVLDKGVRDLRNRARGTVAENWAPGTRLLVGTSGAIALAFPTRDRTVALPSRIIGGMLLARAVTNLSLRRFFGLVRSRRAIRFQKTITVHAPVEQVFEFWSNPENFAKIMEHVQEVKRTGENRFLWTVSGPAGSSISWTSRITQSTPNETLVWRSEPGS